MANALAIQKYTSQFSPQFALVKVTRSGDYVAGGDTVNLNPSAISDPNGIGLLGYPLSVPKLPIAVDSEADQGYIATIVPGATLGTFKIQYWSAEGVELAGGAYPAAITAGSLVLRVPLSD